MDWRITAGSVACIEIGFKYYNNSGAFDFVNETLLNESVSS